MGEKKNKVILGKNGTIICNGEVKSSPFEINGIVFEYNGVWEVIMNQVEELGSLEEDSEKEKEYLAEGYVKKICYIKRSIREPFTLEDAFCACEDLSSKKQSKAEHYQLKSVGQLPPPEGGVSAVKKR